VAESAEVLQRIGGMTIEFNHLLVPLDFEEPSQHALEAAIELARRFGSQLTLLHVYEVPSYVYAQPGTLGVDLAGPIADAAREVLEKTLREAQTKVAGAKAQLRRGAPATEILAAVADVRPDLVVMGTHGRKGVRHALLGSVAEKVVRHSPVPVLTLREEASTDTPRAHVEPNERQQYVR